jgi:Flp pilus assembly protein TadG
MMPLFTALQREFRGPRRARGVAAVEFVVSVPLLLIVMLIAAEVGNLFVKYDTLSYSIRNSARYVSQHAFGETPGKIDLSKAINPGKFLAVYGTDIQGDTPVLPAFSVDDVNVLDAGGGNIEVSATYTYQPLLGDLLPPIRPMLEPPGGGGFKMRVSVTMAAIS